MVDRDVLEHKLSGALDRFKLMSARILFRIRRGINLDNIGTTSVIVRDLCGEIIRAQDYWVEWSLSLPAED